LDVLSDVRAMCAVGFEALIVDAKISTKGEKGCVARNLKVFKKIKRLGRRWAQSRTSELGT